MMFGEWKWHETGPLKTEVKESVYRVYIVYIVCSVMYSRLACFWSGENIAKQLTLCQNGPQSTLLTAFIYYKKSIF